jgi:hypothetical protein
LRRRAPDAQLLISLLGKSDSAEELKARAVADFVEATLAQTIERALALARSTPEPQQPDRVGRASRLEAEAATG